VKITPEEVRATAELARLALDDAEVERMAGELDSILRYMEAIAALDVSTVEPTTHAVPLDLPLRTDVVGTQLSVDEALADAPRRDGAFFEVPKIIEGAE
jgi:aspartyl-tRNA(Asn)/glutamyl-tRNA(Gln) amidotransferase subunit C